MYQIPVRSGNVVRENMATVLFFKTMINTVSKVPEWVPEDDAKVFKSVTRSKLGKHWAWVINTDKSSLSKIKAPQLYAITTLGRPELRGKLITQRPHASDPEPLQERAAVRNAQCELASYEDVDEQVRSRGGAVVLSPPHEPRVWAVLDNVYRCPRCGEEIPSDHVGDDCSDTDSDDDDYNPMPPGSVSSRSHLDQPMTMTSRMSQQSGNQPYYVVFAANNVTNLSLRPGAYLTTALCSLVAPMYYMPIFMFHTQSTYT
jgi:hypothetical protein